VIVSPGISFVCAWPGAHIAAATAVHATAIKVRFISCTSRFIM
jgi:hypothetical protein